MLRSVVDGLILRFFNPREDYFSVELSSKDFRVVRDVFRQSKTYIGVERLPIFFRELAAQKMPWAGAKDWETEEMKISASCSVTGKVTFTIALYKKVGSSQDWQFQTDLQGELGQLPGLADAVEKFFNIDQHAN